MSRSLKERRRQQLAQQRRKRRLLIGVPALIIIVLLGVLIYSRFLQPIEGLHVHASPARGHDAAVEIPDEGMPPVGGVHFPQWLNCGVYRDPVELELAVHSMEHGAIWLAYNPDIPQEQIDRLEGYADNYTLVAPYPGLESNIVATAWGVQLSLDEVPDSRLQSFMTRYKGQGPESGATCLGGVGTPVR